MPSVPLTNVLRAEYDELFNTCEVRIERAATVESIVKKLITNRNRYESASEASGVPWHVIAVIHAMEASLDFSKHLHNGDPLTARTVQVPKGRPKTGNPPFQWEESAADALALRRLDESVEWSLAGTLYQLEGYNGWGYRLYHPEVHSPYLWSFSSQYTSGKYIFDGTWSNTAVSKQVGAAVLLRRMAERRDIEFPDQPLSEEEEPLVPSYSTKKPKDDETLALVIQLQEWLNTFPGIFVKVDGIPAERTSNAYLAVTGSYLPGDPRS